MRKISKIIIHCTATPEGKDFSVDDIRGWHRANGWIDIGYHYVVYRDGTVHTGRPEATPGAHTTGHNSDSIGVCYVGGMDEQMKKAKDTRTPEQKSALRELVKRLLTEYPGSQVYGHSDFNTKKACPSFNVHTEL